MNKIKNVLVNLLASIVVCVYVLFAVIGIVLTVTCIIRIGGLSGWQVVGNLFSALFYATAAVIALNNIGKLLCNSVAYDKLTKEAKEVPDND